MKREVPEPPQEFEDYAAELAKWLDQEVALLMGPDVDEQPEHPVKVYSRCSGTIRQLLMKLGGAHELH